MEHSAQVDVLAQLIGRDKAQMVVALNTLAEAVVGLNQQLLDVQQAAEEARRAAEAVPTAVYAPEEESA